jgi:putative transposase
MTCEQTVAIAARTCVRTLRLKVKRESYAWLDAAAIEVNQVFNWCNASSIDASDRGRRANAKFLSGFELCNLSAGASEYFERIGADRIQRICTEYAAKRRSAKRIKLRWRVSCGARRSLRWVPFKAVNLKRRGVCLRFAGKAFRVFEADRLANVKWRDGCFAQDAVGDWWLCLPVIGALQQVAPPLAAVGIDLGLKDVAVTSEGERLEAGRWTQRYAAKLASAQRRGHKAQAKRIHRKAARCRSDALHKFSRSIVERYQTIVVGDVSSTRLAKTRMAKSVLDAGWGMLRNQLAYKSEHAGRQFIIADEKYTSVVCSSCGSLTGPRGVNGLIVRSWICSECGDSHDRDVNAARNILTAARCSPSMRGNESSPSAVSSSTARRRRETGRRLQAVAA